MLGASGATGIAAVQIGKAMGAKVIGVASTDEKRAIARQAGADIVIGYDNLRDQLKEATGGNGVDVAFDPVGGDAFDALARSMAWSGRLLVIGFASGTIPKFPVNLALVKGFSVVGVYWGAFTAKQPETYADEHARAVRLVACRQGRTHHRRHLSAGRCRRCAEARASAAARPAS